MCCDPWRRNVAACELIRTETQFGAENEVTARAERPCNKDLCLVFAQKGVYIQVGRMT